MDQSSGHVGDVAVDACARSSPAIARTPPEPENTAPWLVCFFCRSAHRHTFVRAELAAQSKAWAMLFQCGRCTGLRRWGFETLCGAVQMPNRAHR
jgi:hypothetical protein